MNKKLFAIFFIITMLALGGNVTAAVKTSPLHHADDADEQWAPAGGCGGPKGQDWANPENWMHDVIPTSVQKAKVNRIPGPIISGHVDVNQLYFAEGNINGLEYAPITAWVASGAEVNAAGPLILGYYSFDRGTLQMDGGVVDVNTHVFVGRNGGGKLIMNNGTMNVLGNFIISGIAATSTTKAGNGSVQLNGGTLHLKQFTYEWPWAEKILPTDPNVPVTPGKASMDISGGQILHDCNVLESGAVIATYQGMIDAGKLTGYNGKGDAVVRFDPDANQVKVTGQKILWDYPDVNVDPCSSLVVDQSWCGFDKMFKSNINDSNATLFLDKPSRFYDVNWSTDANVTVNSIELIAERDDVNGAIPFGRAVRHFKLKAKVGASWQQIYDGNIIYPTNNVVDLIYNLPTPVTAQYFRAEFDGNDVNGVRIRELNATGTRTVEELWDFGDLDIVPTTSLVINDPCQPGMFDIANMFESRHFDKKSTVFVDGNSPGYIYTVVFRPITVGEIRSIELVAEHDDVNNAYQRAAKHFSLKAKSVGSSTYDKTLYDGDINVPYTNNVYRLTVNLSPYVTAQEFKAEFTGNDSLGVRIRELNALGTKTAIGQLWEPGNVVIGDRAPVQANAHQYDIDNAFQKLGDVDPDPCFGYYNSAVFDELALGGVGTIYYVEWKTQSDVLVDAFHLLAAHDSTSAPVNPGTRAMNHLTLKAKSIGSTTYNLTLYDANISFPYGASYDPNVLDLWVNLAVPVTAREFRAEFTARDGYGVRVNELDALGTILPSIAGDVNNDYGVDFMDFAILAGKWRTDNSATATNQVLENFESYSIPSSPTKWADPCNTWINWTSAPTGAPYFSCNFNYLYLLNDAAKAHSGNKALRWTYWLNSSPVTGDDMSGVVFTLPTPIDLRDYSKFRVWVHRKPIPGDPCLNSLENYLGVKFMWQGTQPVPGSTQDPHDSKDIAEAMILSANGSTQEPNGIWSEWVVDLNNDLVFKNRTTTSVNDIYKVGHILFYVNNRLEFAGGKGEIWLDDISLDKKCTALPGDLNGDCKVDFKDLKIMVDNWLQGT
ncbi:MAG: hypothetical protein ABSE89_11605 [Sedimentisphaerales bacterium]